MRYLFLPLLFVSLGLNAQVLQIEDPVSFLALGDSYTIGQNVSTEDRWPIQLADRLMLLGLETEVEIIATTGWTTGDLISALENSPPEYEEYSLVSLLIGVNNQFQGRSIEEYTTQFEELLQNAISYAKGDKTHVFVLSIPDYGYTPFGESFSNVSQQIDLFNSINQQITFNYGVTYINITDISRRGLEDPDLVANDGLHPSGKMYTQWVERIIQRAQIGNIVTSLNTQPESKSLDIYPNPVKDRMSIVVDEPTEVNIYNSQGVLFHSIIEDKTFEIDLSHLSTGIYFISLKSGDLVTRQKFIKS